MNRPPAPQMYRNPRPYNNRWRPPGPLPPAGFQYRPNRHFRPPITNSTYERSEEHWCETCDRGFPTPDLLEQHKQQHQKCNIDGCQFVAHPKVITKHIQMQHSSGLYKKIANLDNPEEIKKWREERKKKYPTKTNIEKKVAECKEKNKRGEKMSLKQERFKNNNSKHTVPGTGNGNKRRHSFDKNNQTNRLNNKQKRHDVLNNKDHPPSKKVARTIPKVPNVIEKNKLKPFAGILNINMQDDDKTDVDSTEDCGNVIIEDDYYEETTPTEPLQQKTAQKSALCGALTSLVCDYGSSDEETNETVNYEKSAEHTIVKDNNFVKKNDVVTTVNINNNYKEVKVEGCDKVDDICENQIIETVTKMTNEISDDDGPEEVKIEKSNDVDSILTTQDTSKSINRSVSTKKNLPSRNNNHKQNNRHKHKIPSTLLYKLLQTEIRHERNIVLQCIRFIKKMNYFDKID